jgi:hypothetical protein
MSFRDAPEVSLPDTDRGAVLSTGQGFSGRVIWIECAMSGGYAMFSFTHRKTISIIIHKPAEG